MIKEEVFARINEINHEIARLLVEQEKYENSAKENDGLTDDEYKEVMSNINMIQQKLMQHLLEVRRLTILIHPGEN